MLKPTIVSLALLTTCGAAVAQEDAGIAVYSIGANEFPSAKQALSMQRDYVEARKVAEKKVQEKRVEDFRQSVRSQLLFSTFFPVYVNIDQGVTDFAVHKVIEELQGLGYEAFPEPANKPPEFERWQLKITVKETK